MNKLTHYNALSPVSWLDQFFADFDRSGTLQKASFSPAVDIAEEGEAYVLRAELPGVPRENIKVEVKENRLTLSGTKDGRGEGERQGYRYLESTYGSFSRSFELPRNVKAEEIGAEYKDGVLLLRIPKAKEALPKTIEIR